MLVLGIDIPKFREITHLAIREGNLEAPKREPIHWQEPGYLDSDAIDDELERVFEICHGCRRCVNLCNSFPTLFDLIDESDTMEVDGVDKADYQKAVDQCYLCDLCAETKCPYLPPHEWAVDFPHLMLRAKARAYSTKKPPIAHRFLSSTERVFDIASTPGISPVVNSVMKSKSLRKAGQKLAQVHADAPIPMFHSDTAKRQLADNLEPTNSPVADERTTGKVAIYVTCYGNVNDPHAVTALADVLVYNGIHVRILKNTHCCGMPKFELGDLKAVAARKDQNLPMFLEAIDDGYDIMSVVPSCTLMYRQEIPLLFDDDEDVKKVQAAFFDPFEYLMLRHRSGLIDTEFECGLGRVTYHAACHQRVQNIGQKTRDFLSLVPDTEVTIIERCSGHGGTHAIREDTYEGAMKIVRPVARRVRESDPQHFGSDCPIAGRLIVHGMNDEIETIHPIRMVAKAYGIPR